ncbi:MAG: adenylate/guanylate cyclase domain-containing protein [Verrucomicrobiota bacterium]
MFACVAGLYWLEQTGHAGRNLSDWEYRYRDAVTAAGRFQPPDDRLLFLAIDSTSVSLSDLDLKTLYADVKQDSAEFRALNIMAAGWPWSREIYALLADRLFEAGASAVVFDLLFPKPAPGDEAFQKALNRFHGRVVVGSNFVSEVIGPGRESWSLNLPSITVVPDAQPGHPSIGYVNFWPGPNGVVRSARYHATLEQMQGGPAPDAVTSETPSSLATRAAAALNAANSSEGFEDRLIRFSGPVGTFTPIPAYQVFVPIYWQRNFSGGDLIRGKVVIVGPYGNWAHDEHATPFGAMPGPELQLNSINALLHHAFISEWPAWTRYLLLALAALGAWIVSTSIVRTWLRVAAFVLLGAAYLAIVKLCYDHANAILFAIPPVLTFGISGLGGFIYDFTRETLEKLRIRRTLEAYVSSDVVRDILDNPASYLKALGGQRTSVALLMSDLRGFTSIAEQVDSHELVAQLNEYLSAMVDDIFALRGSVDKFIGDAILAVWGHLNSSGAAQDTASAIEAALRMQTSLRQLNTGWQSRGLRPFQMGCGVNFGEVIFGNVGSSRKMQPTVIGDAVNATARLEGLTKDYGRELLVGETAAELVRTSFTLQFVDRVVLQGKARPLDLYSVLDGLDQAQKSSMNVYLEIYDGAQTAYRKGAFSKAAALFESCLDHWPNDKLVSIYVKRCHWLAEHPPEGEWQGVHVTTHK